MCDAVRMRTPLRASFPRSWTVAEFDAAFHRRRLLRENVAVFHRRAGRSHLCSCTADWLHRLAAQRLRGFVEGTLRPLRDVDVMFSLHDFAINVPTRVPIVVAARGYSRNEVALPTFQFDLGGWSGVVTGRPITLDIVPPPPWLQRRSRLVWRGTTTGVNQHPWRTRIVALSGQHPGLIDAKCTSAKDAYLSLAEQQRYKYNIYTPGFLDAYSWRLPSLLLGRFVVLMPVHVTYTPWFMAELQPWVHYVPVNETNVTTAIRWLQAHDEEAMAISKAAHRVGRDVVSSACARRAWAHFLLASASRTPQNRTCPGECEMESW